MPAELYRDLQKLLSARSMKGFLPMTITVDDMRCEYERNPTLVAFQSPRLTWTFAAVASAAGQRGQCQTAYRIRAASSRQLLATGTADIWDSGRVESSQSVNVPYTGPQLASGQQVYWSVRVWDRDGNESSDSPVGSWRMALLNPEDWHAAWITTTLPRYMDLCPASYVRKRFAARGAVRRATLYATARGLYEPHLNGVRVGDHLLTPGWTDYNIRIMYQSYDVTDLVNPGENVLGAILGDGWFCGYVGFDRKTGSYGSRPQFLCQLDIEYADGTRESVVSSDAWKSSYGPIEYSDFLIGEAYDARLELGVWCLPGFDDSKWVPVHVEESTGDMKPALVPHIGPPVRVTQELPSLSVTQPVHGTYLFDVGQNMTGWVRLKVSGPAGSIVRIRHGEMLNPDGTLYTTNLRFARATDTYILKGDGVEIYEPRFTFHGFRYVELTGFPVSPGTSAPAKDCITGIAIESDAECSGDFHCSSELVNQLYQNIVWGQRGNFLSVPTDCPQRDERLGWMGDAQIFVRTACYNRDVATFFEKWVVDVADAQLPEGSFTDIVPTMANHVIKVVPGAPAWADAGVIVPWTVAQVYDDMRLFESHYESMTRWIDFLTASNPDFIWSNIQGNNFGDWLSIEADTDKTLLATAYFAYDASLMARIATHLGKSDDATRYTELFNKIKAAFQQKFVGTGGILTGDTQTAYVLALRFNLLAPEMIAVAAKHLVENIRGKGNHLSTGFVGVGYLCPVLSDAGYNDVAYTLLLNETFPSWGYSIRNGATTIWERWDGWTEMNGFQTPDMNSFNHYSLGSVGEWLFGYVAGIDMAADARGFDKIVLRPRPDARLTRARASYRSVHGTISSDWSYDGRKFEWTINVPVNTTARVCVPSNTSDEVTEGSEPAPQAEGVKSLQVEPGCAIYEVGAGTYRFESLFSGITNPD